MLRFFGLVICFLVSVSWLMASGQKQEESKRTPVYQEHLDLSYYLDLKGEKQPIKTWNDWENRRSHILANMQTVMGELPHPVKPISLDMKVLEENTIGSTKRFKISYHTDDSKQRVRAYLFVPQSATKQHPVPAVLCLHQTNSKIGKEEPSGIRGLPNLKYALELAKRGYVSLAPDYPSFGEYPYDFKAHPEYRSGTMKAIYDNMDEFRANNAHTKQIVPSKSVSLKFPLHPGAERYFKK